MTPDEIQALREKHRVCDCGYCVLDECVAGCVGEYPCDVIKVLDASENADISCDTKQTENLKSNDLKTEGKKL